MAHPALIAGYVGVSLVGGLLASSSKRKAGRRAREAAYANAAGVLQLANKNAAATQQIAGINAAAIRNTGYVNAASIERAAMRNGQLMMIEGAETLRRHVLDERYDFGMIRAVQASSGWSINEGTPRAFQVQQQKEMMNEREFIALQQEMSLFTMLMNEGDKAYVTRYAADQSSSALLASASIQADVLLAEAAAQAAAYRREGDLARSGANAAATAQLFNTGANLIGAFV